MSDANTNDFAYRCAVALGWPSPEPCENEADYADCLERRNELSSLYNSGTDVPDDKRDALYQRLRAYEEAMVVYNRRFILKEGTALHLAKYMAWNKRFTSIDNLTAYLEARDHCVLRKKVMEDGRIHLYVVGLDYEVGDNVFTSSRDGARQYRKYSKTVGRQAISVCKEMPFKGQELSEFAATIPDLDPSFHETGVGDAKGHIRAIVMPQKLQVQLHNYLSDSPYRHTRSIDKMDPWIGYRGRTDAPTTGVLFA